MGFSGGFEKGMECEATILAETGLGRIIGQAFPILNKTEAH